MPEDARERGFSGFAKVSHRLVQQNGAGRGAEVEGHHGRERGQVLFLRAGRVDHHHREPGRLEHAHQVGQLLHQAPQRRVTAAEVHQERGLRHQRVLEQAIQPLERQRRICWLGRPGNAIEVLGERVVGRVHVRHEQRPAVRCRLLGHPADRRRLPGFSAPDEEHHLLAGRQVGALSENAPAGLAGDGPARDLQLRVVVLVGVVELHDGGIGGLYRVILLADGGDVLSGLRNGHDVSSVGVGGLWFPCKPGEHLRHLVG